MSRPPTVKDALVDAFSALDGRGITTADLTRRVYGADSPSHRALLHVAIKRLRAERPDLEIRTSYVYHARRVRL